MISYRKISNVSPDKLSAYPRLSSLLNSGFMLICQSLTGKSDRKSSNQCYGFSTNLLPCKGEQTHVGKIFLSSVVLNVFFRNPAHFQIHLCSTFSFAIPSFRQDRHLSVSISSHRSSFGTLPFRAGCRAVYGLVPRALFIGVIQLQRL